MGNVNTKINLKQLIHQQKMVAGKNGEVECLIIPIEANHLYVGAKGVYLDLIGFELPNGSGNDTHLVKQSLPEAIRKAQTDEEKRAMPILGNHIVWGESSSAAPAKPAPKAKSSKAAQDDDEPPF